MGCDSQDSNFMYDIYRPEDGKWWATSGEPAFFVPMGYENELAKKLRRFVTNARINGHIVRFRVKVVNNRHGRGYEARQIDYQRLDTR